MKIMIEMDDTLDDRAAGACDEVKEELLRFLAENPDTDEVPDLNNDLDYSGAVYGIIDGSVPIYTYEIKTAWFLHGPALEEAYENAGVGENPMENDGMAAIYYFISDAVNTWYADNAEDIFQEWKTARAGDDVKADV